MIPSTSTGCLLLHWRSNSASDALSPGNRYMLPLWRVITMQTATSAARPKASDTFHSAIWQLAIAVLLSLLIDTCLSACSLSVDMNAFCKLLQRVCRLVLDLKSPLPILGTFDLAVGKTTSHNNYYNEGEDNKCTARLHCMLISRLCVPPIDSISTCVYSFAVVLPLTIFDLSGNEMSGDFCLNLCRAHESWSFSLTQSFVFHITGKNLDLSGRHSTVYALLWVCSFRQP